MPAATPVRTANKAFATRNSQFALLLFLSSNRLGRTFARARIGVGALAAHRQSAPMAQAAIAAEVHQPLDVDAGLATKIALDHVVAVDHFADLQHFLIAQLADAAIQRDLHLLHDVPGALFADAMDVLKRDEDALVGRNIHAGNTGHECLSCRRSLEGAACLVLLSRAGVRKREHDALPLRSEGPGIVLETNRLGCGVINGLQWLSSTPSGAPDPKFA